MNNVAVEEEYKYLARIMTLFSLDINPEVGFLDHMVVPVLIS